MIIYILTKDPLSQLSQIQTRLWRQYQPQAEVMRIQTENSQSRVVANRCIRFLQKEGHRFGLILHEDCLPIRPIDVESILGGKTFAGRVGHGGAPHPSRTWLAVDKTVEGMSCQQYGERIPTRDDVDAPDDLLETMQYLEPGFLHLDNWYKLPEDHPSRMRKRDWMQSYFSAYNNLPKLTTRMYSFARAAATHVRKGMPHVPLSIWLERQAICKSCDHFTGRNCLLCGCGIMTKSRWAGSHCPVGRWPELEEEDDFDDDDHSEE